MTSATTSDKEFGRNPHRPGGLRRDGPAFFVVPPRQWTGIDSSSLREIEAVALATIAMLFQERDTRLPGKQHMSAGALAQSVSKCDENQNDKATIYHKRDRR